MGEFDVQNLANMAWAFATVGQSDAVLFEALAKAAERLVGDFNAQHLGSTVWAFATAGHRAPASLDPISILDAIEVQGSKPQVLLRSLRGPLRLF